MKKYLPYLLLFAYLITIMKPVIPYITDGVAHILYFEDHMTMVHAHNGNYHVHNEVAEATKKDSPDKNADNTLKKITSGAEHIVASKSDISGLSKVIAAYFPESPFFIENICLSGNYPPPRA